MAGHSKWANIKHKKAATDAKRGKAWSKISKAIMVAAKSGSDPDVNIRLRTLIAEARAVSMPKDNIERAVKKGAGELDGAAAFEEIIYEGYGPEGVAIMCEILTDNRNRTAPELRKLFEKGGGKMGATGCVSYLFDRKGLFLIAQDKTDEERLMEIAMEAGAEDITTTDDGFEVICDPDTFSDVSDALDAAEIECESKSVTRIPQNTVDLDANTGKRVLGLIESLDDHDDVQSVSSNFNISDEAMAQIEAEA